MAQGVDMKVSVEGEAELKALMLRLGLDLNDLRDAMTQVGEHAKTYFGGQVFTSRGRVLNQPWPPLSDTYAEWKARRYGSPPLIRTGLMQRSFVDEVSPMSVTITNDAPWFKYHQSSAPRKRLPRRAMIGIYKGMREDDIRIISAAISRKIRARTGV